MKLFSTTPGQIKTLIYGKTFQVLIFPSLKGQYRHCNILQEFLLHFLSHSEKQAQLTQKSLACTMIETTTALISKALLCGQEFLIIR